MIRIELRWDHEMKEYEEKLEELKKECLPFLLDVDLSLTVVKLNSYPFGHFSVVVVSLYYPPSGVMK